MGSAKLAVFALLIAALALGIAVLGPSREPRAAEPALAAPDSGQNNVEQRLAALEARLQELEAELELVPSRPISPLAEPRRPAENEVQQYADLEARLVEVERRLAGAEGADRRTFRALMAGKDPDEDEEDQGSIDDWIGRGNDRNSTPEEMLLALRRLRGRTLEDGTDARLPVLFAMIELSQTSQDGEVRADVWRQLDGVTDPSLLTPLLDALANDPHPRAREEAAESLAAFLPDPNVEAALRYAMENDEDAGVRRQAAESLSGRRR